MDSPPRYSRLPRVGEGKFSFIPGDADHYGWLLLKETPRLVSRAAYPQLFRAFGEFYGKGDGKTTFALPSAGDCFLMMAGAAHKLGEKGGAERVTLDPKHLPPHVHKVDKVTIAPTAPQKALLTGVGLGDVTKPPTTSIASQDSGAAGGGEPVPIMPPFFAVNVFVYAGG